MEPRVILLLALYFIVPFLLPALLACLRCTAPRWLRWGLDGLFVLPLVVPYTLLSGFFFSSWRDRLSEISENTEWVGSRHLMEVAAVYLRTATHTLLIEFFLTCCLVYFCAWMGFRKVQPEWIEAAQMQGMGPCGRFWRIWVPTAKGWLFVAALLALWHLVSAIVGMSMCTIVIASP
jgi:ABC-type Fe3+ transport system permease subunit